MTSLITFACGAAAAEILRAGFSRGLARWRAINRRPPDPPRTQHSVIPDPRFRLKDPRTEALALLEVCDWDFDRAFRWCLEIMSESMDRDLEFWSQVHRCVEIFQAGKRTAA